MRKLWVFVCCIFTWAGAQTSSQIHHLFGLKQSAGGLTQAAINQQFNRTVEIETFSPVFSLGGPYAYFTSNNKVLYLNTTVPTVGFIQQYLLPGVYSLSHSGLSGATTVQGSIVSICVNPVVDSMIYAFDFSTKTPLTFSSNGVILEQGNTLSQLTDINSLNQVYFQNAIYFAGSNNNNEVELYRLSDTGLQTTGAEVYGFESLYLVSDQLWGIYGLARNASQQNYLVQLDPLTLSLDTVVLLPSCINCNQDNYEYDKNALVIDSENGHLILSRSEDLSGASVEYFLSTFDLATGTTIYDVKTADRWSNLIFQKPQDDLVYPGDANFDKLVDMEDILPIGLKYNDQVVGRLVISNDWIGQESTNTLDTLANGTDKKHADCNGDGQVNAIDFDAVIQNYSNIHYSDKTIQGGCDFPLYLEYPNWVKEGEEITMQIGLDFSVNPSQDVYGLIFTLEYDESFVANTTGMISILGGSTWFGTENLDYIQRSIKVSPGKMEVGLVGIDKLNRAGAGGVLLTGVWTMEDVVIPITQNYSDMAMRITNVTLIDYDENHIDACGVDTFIRVYDKDVGLIERELVDLPLFPNPTRFNHISLSCKGAIEKVELYDVQGHIIHSEIRDDVVFFGDIPKGIYLIKVYTYDLIMVNKFMYIH